MDESPDSDESEPSNQDASSIYKDDESWSGLESEIPEGEEDDETSSERHVNGDADGQSSGERYLTCFPVSYLNVVWKG